MWLADIVRYLLEPSHISADEEPVKRLDEKQAELICRITTVEAWIDPIRAMIEQMHEPDEELSDELQQHH